MESAPNRDHPGFEASLWSGTAREAMVSPSLRDERQRLAKQLAEVERALKILATRLEPKLADKPRRWV